MSNSFRDPLFEKNGHSRGEHDRGHESGFTTRCLLHNFQSLEVLSRLDTCFFHAMDA